MANEGKLRKRFGIILEYTAISCMAFFASISDDEYLNIASKQFLGNESHVTCYIGK
jgi:hypothetical protein